MKISISYCACTGSCPSLFQSVFFHLVTDKADPGFCLMVYSGPISQCVLMICLSPAAGVFCDIVTHAADSVVSVLNKESGSTAVQVLKKLGPKGEWTTVGLVSFRKHILPQSCHRCDLVPRGTLSNQTLSGYWARIGGSK